jgi:putative transposase
MRSFAYRLHPTQSQEQSLLCVLGQCRDLYNAALEQRVTAYKQQGRSITRFEQQTELTRLRESEPTWKATSVHAQRSALIQLDRAFTGFFRRCAAGSKPGFPRFRSERRSHGFTLPKEAWWKPEKILKKDRLLVPKIGHVKVNLYRPIAGEVREVTICRDAGGRWRAIFQCYVGEAPTKVAVKSAVGIDLGLRDLLTLSNGETIENPRCGQKASRTIARRQRALARKQLGSANAAHARESLARAYAKIAAQRLDYARKTAKDLFARFDMIVHEDLRIAEMVRSQFSKSVSDVSWGVFLRCLALKAEEAGRHLVPVDPRMTSQWCSGCGEVVYKTSSQRRHTCRKCGLAIDRDHNAALNVRALGQSALESARADVEGKVPSRNEAVQMLFC